MSYTTQRSYSIVACCKILGVMLFSCLSIEVTSHTVQWPSGKYGLPMAKSGCPKANGFSWETGYIYQDLEDDKSLTQTSSSFHLNATVFSSGDVSRHFCLKMNRSATVDNSRFSWPAGQYCIYKKGGSCPKLLLDGWVLWDDENGKTGANLNFQSGTLPAGIYKKDTKIYFCCQTIGWRSDPIELPIESPFYLIAYNSRSCQEVLKTIHTLEYIRYDTENDMNQDSQAHPYPYGADLSMPYIYYCYYRACRWTKTSLTGSFWSPNYPNTYKDKAWCDWYINVPRNYIISLTFLDFRLEMIDMCVTASCNCDYVEVQENFSNGTSVIVGRYCMGVAYPHGDIKTRSNNVTVTFRSDSTIGSAGFKARYKAIQITTPTSPGSTTKETQATSPKVVSTVNLATFPLTSETNQGTSSGSSTSSSTSSSDSNTTTAASTTSNSTTTTVTTTSNGTRTTTATTTSNSNRTTAATTPPNSNATTVETITSNSTRTTTATTTSNGTSTKLTTLAGNASGKPTSETPTANTKQKDTTVFPFTNASSTETSWTTVDKTSARSSEATEESSTTRLATEQHISPSGQSSEKGRATTPTANGDGVKRVGNENPSTARNVYVIVAVTVSLIVISAVVAGSIFCLYRKRRLKGKHTDQDRLSVAFRAAEKKGRVANGVPNIYGTSGENAEEEHYSYIDHEKEQLNVLYDNRAFMHSDEKLEEDEETKESDNPLYSSSVEIEQDENRNVLYESMDEVSQNVIEAETINPVYERFA